MKPIKEKVKVLLKCYPKLRDSNEELYAEYLYIYVFKKNERFFKVTLFDFLKGIEFTNAPSLESIARFSRQIQEQQPELRGEQYEQRHAKQNKVLKDLGYGL